MIFAAILLGLCQIIAMFGACLLLRHFLNVKQAEIEAKAEAALHSWVESPKPGEPSKLAVMLDSTGAVIGAATARSFLYSIKTDTGHVGNMATGVAADLEAKQHPIMALLAGSKRGKGAAVARLAEILAPMFAGKGSSDGGSKPPHNFSL